IKPRSLGDLVGFWYAFKGKFLVVLADLSDHRSKLNHGFLGADSEGGIAQGVALPIIQNGDFVFMMEDPETKMEVETTYEQLKDNEKKQLGKNNEAKMTLYNALPRKEYERVFMCKTAKEFWHTFINTHQGNSQVKDCKIDLVTQLYEKFSISSKETIDSCFTRFNAIVTSLKSLDQDYSSKNHVRKFLCALPLIWRANVMTIEEAKDLATLSLDELISNLKVYEIILVNDNVAYYTTKENVKSLALKAKVIGEQNSDDSDRVIDSEEAAKMVLEIEAPKFKTKAEDDNKPQQDAICLMVIDSQEVHPKPSTSNNNVDLHELQNENEELLKFNNDFAKTFEKLLKEKRSLESEQSKLLNKINDLEFKVKKVTNDKEVVEPYKNVMYSHKRLTL
ncbi:hypothetical protein Tco_0616655, partial [Tanacetum coccineum]